MPKTLIKLTTWSLSKKRALNKLNNKACGVFEKVVAGLLKDGVDIGSASVAPASLTGFLRYQGTYEISVTKKPHVGISVISRFNFTKPTSKQVKATKKKVYKRDEKGRFKKGK